MNKPEPAQLNTALAILLAGMAYYVFGRLGLLLAIPPGYATAVWPASGLALAGMLLMGYRISPGVMLGSFCVNVGTAFDSSSPYTILVSITIALGIGFGAAASAGVGTYLI